MISETDATRAAALANAYSVLSRALGPPRSWDARLLRDARIPFDPLGHEFARAMTRLARELAAAQRNRTKVEVAYARLFLGPFAIEAPPYASLYIDPHHRIMGETSAAAAEAYAEAGLDPAAGPREAPDHVTRELEFMYYLRYRYATTGEEMWRHRARRFWAKHLGLWLPWFAKRIAAAHPPPVYRALARSLECLSDLEQSPDGTHEGSARARRG